MDPLNASSQTQTQLSAATALVQLLQVQEDLGLPKLAWRISDLEPISGQLFGSGPRGVGALPTVEAWAQALGAEVRQTPFEYGGDAHVQFGVETVWRDVPVRVFLSCPVSALAEQVAA